MGITPILLGVGLAASAAGTITQVEAAKRNSRAQEEEIAAQKRAEAQRRQAMELDARRRQLEALRNQQRARALALSAATNQGAEFSSGLQGGYGQIAGQTGNSILGTSQNLQIGENIFAANADVSQARMDMANAGYISSIGGGLTSFGSNLYKAAGPISALSKGFSFGSPNNYYGQSYGSFISGLGRGPIY